MLRQRKRRIIMMYRRKGKVSSESQPEDQFLTSLPEFAGMTSIEIRQWLENAIQREHLQWEKDFQCKLDEERKTFHETLQKEKAHDLPTAEVFVEDVIKIDMGSNKKLYISRELIKRSLRTPVFYHNY